jgi:hypothetical protein
MNISAFFQYNLSIFQKRLSDIDINCPDFSNFNVKVKYNRCMARVYDKNRIDINKRCKKHANHLDLCLVHSKNKELSRIDEMPSEKYLCMFRKKDTEIDNKIDLNHNAFSIEEIKTRLCREILENKIFDKSNMDVIQILENTKDEIISSLGINNTFGKLKTSDLVYKYATERFSRLKFTKKSIYEFSDRLLKYLHDNPPNNIQSVIETSVINNLANLNISKIETSIETQEPDKISIEIKPKRIIRKKTLHTATPAKQITIIIPENINLDDYPNKEIIYITDNESNTAEFYIVEFNHKPYIYTDKGRMAGNIREWIDDDDEVPNSFKSSENKVLRPDNNLPVLEFEITPSGGLFSGIVPEVYREFQYDDDSQIFRLNPNISK